MYVASHYLLSLLFTAPGLPKPLLQPKPARYPDFTADVLFVRLNGPFGVAKFLRNLTACISFFYQLQHPHLGILKQTAVSYQPAVLRTHFLSFVIVRLIGCAIDHLHPPLRVPLRPETSGRLNLFDLVISSNSGL